MYTSGMCAGSTALHLACSAAGGLVDVVDALIQKGAAVSAADRHGYTPLQRACQHDHAGVARMLIVQAAASPHRRVPHTGNVPLHLAAELGHIDTVQVRLTLTTLNDVSNQKPAWLFVPAFQFRPNSETRNLVFMAKACTRTRDLNVVFEDG